MHRDRQARRCVMQQEARKDRNEINRKHLETAVIETAVLSRESRARRVLWMTKWFTHS